MTDGITIEGAEAQGAGEQEALGGAVGAAEAVVALVVARVASGKRSRRWR